MNHDATNGRTAREAFNAIVARKTRMGLTRIRRWDPLAMEDDLEDDRVLREVYQETDRSAAREILRQITGQATSLREPIHLTPLGELPPATEGRFRVQGLIPMESNVLIVAQRKAGKTTFALNLVQAMLTGDDFLGRFPVTPVEGAVAFLNFELSGEMFSGWSRRLSLPEDRVLVANVRGRGNPFNSREVLCELAQEMQRHAVEVLVVDPFSVAFTGQDANSPGEVRAWLTALEDWFRGEAGGREIILTAHSGWSAEGRARGASSLEDWPDSIVTLRADERSGERTLAVRGRDVSVEPVTINMDPETRLLHAGPRSVNDSLTDACIEVIAEQPGLNTEQISAALRDLSITFRKGEENRALRELVDSGRVVVRPGIKGARLHYLSF